MKVLKIIENLLFVLCVVFIFISWKVALGLFLLISLVHVIPFGPAQFLLVFSGYLYVGGFVAFFFNWKIAILFIMLGYVVTRFRMWGMELEKEESLNTLEKK